MSDIYSFAWREWGINERLNLLILAHINYEYNHETGTITIDQPLSSGQRELFEFVRDPIYPIKFYILDSNLGRQTLKVFHDFWTWRFK